MLSTAILNVTVSGQSMACRLVNSKGYISLSIPRGDTTAPHMSALTFANSSYLAGAQAPVEVTATDPTGTGDLFVSGLNSVYVVYSLNNGPFVFQKMSSQTSYFIYSFDTSKTGNYSYIIVAVDNAGNIAYLSSGNNFFTFIVKPIPTTPPTTTSSETSTTTPLTTTNTSSTNTSSSSNSSTPTIKSGSTPGFEISTLLISLVIFVSFFKLRKRNK